MTEIPRQQQPAPEGYASWLEYWQAQGMPRRTERELAPERQAYLAMRRSTSPDTELGIYPFRDIEPPLTRAGALATGRWIRPRRARDRVIRSPAPLARTIALV
jgi:hypothetical protein